MDTKWSDADLIKWTEDWFTHQVDTGEWPPIRYIVGGIATNENGVSGYIDKGMINTMLEVGATPEDLGWTIKLLVNPALFVQDVMKIVWSINHPTKRLK